MSIGPLLGEIWMPNTKWRTIDVTGQERESKKGVLGVFQFQWHTVGFTIFPYTVGLVCKIPSYVECTRYSRNISLIYIKVRWLPQTQSNHGFRCFTKHRCPEDEGVFCSYGTYVLWPCMRTGWLLETSPSDHFWRRYEVGQWLVFGWFWGWGTSDMWFAPVRIVALKY
jgi:hypothetical protein